MPSLPLTPGTLPEYVELYRHLHAHPELSMQEQQTAELITRRLAAVGADPKPCGGTGVVGVLRNGDGPVIAWRADTDGLPVLEQTGLPYASTATGILPDGAEVPVMHACGHDSHTTAGLALVELLATNRDLWAGTLVAIFQPGEETAAGAVAMVDDGLWDLAPRPEVVLGQHSTALPRGRVQIKAGDAMAMADSWRVTLHGRGSHGSQPQRSIDPVVMAAHAITRLQTVVSRETSPLTPAVVTVATIHAGLKENVIPSEAELTLNIRTTEPTSRERVLAGVRRIIEAEAAASGAPAPSIDVLYRFPRLYNDPAHTAHVATALRAGLGDDAVEEMTTIRMGSEDVGYLGDSIGVPTVYWFFGGHDPQTYDEATTPGGHSPFYAPGDGGIVETGIRAALSAVLAYLGRQR